MIESLIDETFGYGTIRMSVLIYRLVLVLKLYGTINLMNPCYGGERACIDLPTVENMTVESVHIEVSSTRAIECEHLQQCETREVVHTHLESLNLCMHACMRVHGAWSNRLQLSASS